MKKPYYVTGAVAGGREIEPGVSCQSQHIPHIPCASMAEAIRLSRRLNTAFSIGHAAGVRAERRRVKKNIQRCD